MNDLEGEWGGGVRLTYLTSCQFFLKGGESLEFPFLYFFPFFSGGVRESCLHKSCLHTHSLKGKMQRKKNACLIMTPMQELLHGVLPGTFYLHLTA